MSEILQGFYRILQGMPQGALNKIPLFNLINILQNSNLGCSF